MKNSVEDCHREGTTLPIRQSKKERIIQESVKYEGGGEHKNDTLFVPVKSERFRLRMVGQRDSGKMVKRDKKKKVKGKGGKK